MPPPDPRDRPALERALPDDADPHGEHRDVHTMADVLFGDNEWHRVEVRAWQKDRHGRWRCLIEWGRTEPADTFEGWFVYDGEKMREGGELGILVRGLAGPASTGSLTGQRLAPRPDLG